MTTVEMTGDALLFGDGANLLNVKCFKGDAPCTKEELRAELFSALRQRKDGTATVSDRFNDDAPKIDVRE